MLKSIYIESLFGLYTYQLDIMPVGSEPIRFKHTYLEWTFKRQSSY